MNKCKCSCDYCKTGEHCGAYVTCGKQYTSKTNRQECNNEGCIIPRQNGSKYCFECSYNYANKKYEKR